MAHGASGVTGHGGGHAGAAPGEHEAGHPGERTYIEVAIILAIITLVEVAIYYIDWMHENDVLVPALLLLSAVKFATVVGYFMHLKFDDNRFLWIFASGLVVAFAIIMTLYALFHWHVIDYATRLF
jgi:cytochrome c oxidase subunit 4